MTTATRNIRCVEIVTDPTKADEIRTWANFVSALPEGSYLHGMFAGSVGAVEANIRNDFAYDPIPELHRRQNEMAAELKDAAERLAALKAEIKTAEKTLANTARSGEQARDALDAMRKEARRIAGF